MPGISGKRSKPKTAKPALIGPVPGCIESKYENIHHIQGISLQPSSEKEDNYREEIQRDPTVAMQAVSGPDTFVAQSDDDEEDTSLDDVEPWEPLKHYEELDDIDFNDPDAVYEPRLIATGVTRNAYESYCERYWKGREYLMHQGHRLKISFENGKIFVIDKAPSRIHSTVSGELMAGLKLCVYSSGLPYDTTLNTGFGINYDRSDPAIEIIPDGGIEFSSLDQCGIPVGSINTVYLFICLLYFNIDWAFYHDCNRDFKYAGHE